MKRVVEPGYVYSPQPRLKTDLFLTMLFGGLAGIWVATAGPAWVIAAFKEHDGRDATAGA